MLILVILFEEQLDLQNRACIKELSEICPCFSDYNGNTILIGVFSEI